MSTKRKKIFQDENTRSKIQASNIITRLTNFVMAKPTDNDYEAKSMTAPQVNAAVKLLNKILPDLQSVQVDQTVQQTNYVIGSSPQLDAKEWANKYKSSGNPSQDPKPH